MTPWKPRIGWTPTETYNHHVVKYYERSIRIDYTPRDVLDRHDAADRRYAREEDWSRG